MKVVIAGGGTGGHLFPAIALGEELMRQRPGTEVAFVGTSAGLEAKWLPSTSYKYVLFDVHGVRGHGLLQRLCAVGEFLRAVLEARRTLKLLSPAIVASAGGYASAPMAMAAIVARIPLLLMEQNTRPGLTNRMFWRFARKVCVGFEETAKFFDRTKVEITGNPVRFKVADNPRLPGLDPFQILVLGGSSGAHRLNLGVLKAFEILGKSVIKWQVLHQTGSADEDMVRRAYTSRGEALMKARVVSFIDNIGEAMSEANLIIARAGAMTVSEIALAGRPAIFVPYPYHRDLQQRHNAAVIERIGGAVVVGDDDCLAENLARVLAELAVDRERLIHMGQRARGAAMADAAERVARICFEIADTSKAAA